MASEALARKFKFVGRQAYWGEVDSATDKDWKDFLGGANHSKRQEARAKAMYQIVQDTIQIQHKAGNMWFADHFPQEALDQVTQRNPKLLDEWLEVAFSEGSDDRRRVRLARSFYETLCIVLLKQLPDKGLKLYQQLRIQDTLIRTRSRTTKVWPLDSHLFNMFPSALAEDAWQQRLEDCDTDEMLMEVAILAQQGQAGEWLLAIVDEGLQDTSPFKWSRAITLLSFVNDAATDERLGDLALEQPDTWHRSLVETAHHRWKTNNWARYWFQRFLTVADDETAWAAFRLLLHVADRRFWVWYQQVQEQAEQTHYSAERKQFFAHNLDSLRHAMERNEEPLRDHFLGQKVLNNEMWPWMR